MITTRQATEQIQRLTALPGFSSIAPAGQLELAKALEACQSLQHARATIDAILETAKFSPAPSEIRAAASSIAENFRPQQPEVHCDNCHGSGYESAEYLVEWRGGRSFATRLTKMQAQELRGKDLRINRSMVYTGADFCDCPKGRRLREAQSAPPPIVEPRRRGGLTPIREAIH